MREVYKKNIDKLIKFIREKEEDDKTKIEVKLDKKKKKKDENLDSK